MCKIRPGAHSLGLLGFDNVIFACTVLTSLPVCKTSLHIYLQGASKEFPQGGPLYKVISIFLRWWCIITCIMGLSGNYRASIAGAEGTLQDAHIAIGVPSASEV